MKLQKFDYQIKDNKKNKSIIVVSVLLVAIVAGFIIYRSFAAYKVTESYNIIKGSVAEFTNNPLMISYNLVGEDGGVMSTSEIPSNKEYEFDAIKSKCTNGNSIVYDKSTNTFTIGDGSESLEDTCELYFNFIPLSKQTLFALGYTMDDVKEGIPYGPDGTGESGFYAAPDNYGTSYYFYGGSEYPPYIDYGVNAGLLIRINGDGSLRVSIEYWESRLYNDFEDDNTYLGYMYGDSGADNILDTHSNKTSSPVKNFMKSCYEDILRPISDSLGDAYFCNDRSVYKEEYGEKEADDTALGTGKNTTYYGTYYRLRNNTPSFMCDKNDSFTVEESEYGNGKLEEAIGTLSMDEMYMTGFDQWFSSELGTMSPTMFKDNVGYYYTSLWGSIGVKNIKYNNSDFVPVINFKHGTVFEGDSGYFTLVQ